MQRFSEPYNLHLFFKISTFKTDIMLKQKLQQKLLQKLSPQQIQLIKLLEVPTVQLEQRIKKEIEENPVLEEGRSDDDEGPMDEQPDDDIDTADNDDFSLDDYIDDEETPSYKLVSNNYSKDDKKMDIPYSVGASFHEYLLSQLGVRIMDDEKIAVAEYIIGNIDDDGYLRRDIDSIVDDLAFAQNIITNEKSVKEILEIIQDFDPVGVAARSLKECLILQLDKKINSTSNPRPGLVLAKNVLANFFLEFTKKHYEKIISRLGVEEEDMKDAIGEILKLNPKPGSSFADSQAKDFQQIIPDFILEVKDGEPHILLNSKNAPELRISQAYADMIEDYQNNKKMYNKQKKEALTFIKQKLDSAKWFIDAIKQRQNTLLLTMQAIADYQRDYFLEGDETYLRPMILKDIAEKTNLDISTISRVANSKFIQTHFGIFALTYFFSEGMQTNAGEEVSTREIKKILQTCIEGESKRKPLTDERLAQILQSKGYQIARRTVAKYREQLNIPVARLRKEL